MRKREIGVLRGYVGGACEVRSQLQWRPKDGSGFWLPPHDFDDDDADDALMMPWSAFSLHSRTHASAHAGVLCLMCVRAVVCVAVRREFCVCVCPWRRVPLARSELASAVVRRGNRLGNRESAVFWSHSLKLPRSPFLVPSSAETKLLIQYYTHQDTDKRIVSLSLLS